MARNAVSGASAGRLSQAISNLTHRHGHNLKNVLFTCDTRVTKGDDVFILLDYGIWLSRLRCTSASSQRTTFEELWNSKKLLYMCTPYCSARDDYSTRASQPNTASS